MPKSHRVKQGECIASIAHAYGLAGKTIWDDPGNDELRQKGRTPTILFEGDAVTIPEVTPKVIAAATGQSHTIRIRREKAMLRVKMLSNGKPIANEPFDLVIDGEPAKSGTSKADGTVESEVSPLAVEAIIRFPQRAETHTVRLGHLDPVDSPSGVQARLHQLGFYRGALDGKASAMTQALTSFQRTNGLDQTGLADDSTRRALVKAYGA